jgi:hypothetical protein
MREVWPAVTANVPLLHPPTVVSWYSPAERTKRNPWWSLSLACATTRPAESRTATEPSAGQRAPWQADSPDWRTGPR